MTMLAEQVDGVIGVDTHRDTLAAAAVSALGAVLAHAESSADQRGYRELLAFARERIPGARCWALEGTGSYGAGLIASAPEDLRAELRGKGRKAVISYCARLRARPTQTIEHRMTVRALRTTATRVQALRAEADELEAEIVVLAEAMAPELLQLPGADPISAAQIGPGVLSLTHGAK